MPPPRLAGLPPTRLRPDQQRLYQAITGGPRAAGPQAFPLVDDQGRLRGPFNAMLLSPPVGHAVQALGAAVRYRSVLADRARELAILTVAAHWGSAFEREAHEAVGRSCGLTEGETAALAAGGVPDLSDHGERVVVHTVRALLRAGRLTDAEYAEAVRCVGARGLFELTTLVGYYGLLALHLRVFGGEDPPQADHPHSPHLHATRDR